MNTSNLSDELRRAEGMLIEGQIEHAERELSRLAADAQEYINQNYQATETKQYFSFPTIFERLCYKRVENDPREIIVVEEPYDRMYADLGMAHAMLGDYTMAQEALKQAVRWNPMECEYRLRLADLFVTNGNIDEYLALTYSVFERASDAEHVVRAFVNFAGYFLKTGREMLCASALFCAKRFDMPESHLAQALEEAAQTAHDPSLVDAEEARQILATEGLPDGANAEVAICLLMCASDAAQVGDKILATNLTLRARNLVGAPACSAFIELIHDAQKDEVIDDGQ